MHAQFYKLRYTVTEEKKRKRLGRINLWDFVANHVCRLPCVHSREFLPDVIGEFLRFGGTIFCGFNWLKFRLGANFCRKPLNHKEWVEKRAILEALEKCVPADSPFKQV